MLHGIGHGREPAKATGYAARDTVITRGPHLKRQTLNEFVIAKSLQVACRLGPLPLLVWLRTHIAVILLARKRTHESHDIVLYSTIINHQHITVRRKQRVRRLQRV